MFHSSAEEVGPQAGHRSRGVICLWLGWSGISGLGIGIGVKQMGHEGHELGA